MDQPHKNILISSLNLDISNSLWINSEIFVKNIQKKIYQASLLGDGDYLRHYQEILIHSKEAKYIALKRTVKVNRNKIDTSIDYASFYNLYLNGKAKTFYATLLGQSNKKVNKPTFEDLIMQNLVLLAIEPEWEARLETSSYGFRSGYSLQQALIKTYAILTHNFLYVDSTVVSYRIESPFSNVYFSFLLQKSGYTGLLLEQLFSWLNADYLHKQYKRLHSKFQHFDIYFFQSYTICPVLADIIFYGLQQAIDWHNLKIGDTSIFPINIVRYGREIIIIFAINQSVRITKILTVISKFFKALGLQIDQSSTNLSSIYAGFDFLGYRFRRYNNYNFWNMEDSKLLITPMSENIKKHFRSIKKCLYHKDKLNRWRANSQMRQDDVIERLNPLIQSFSDYYSCFVPLRILKRMDWTVNEMIYRYAIKKYKSAKYEKWNLNWIKIINGKRMIAYKDGFNDNVIPLKLHSTIAYQIYQRNRLLPNYLYQDKL
uniref:Putative reverse transcriptase/maturase n=1 Tax=Boldia erythrosiphon TaxID=74908 RepID=A0A1Y9TLR2_9RHOD|nr:putative reverse transcriptase/maturase [Boldia erythrosiphon]ARO90560.1 putative reverse transcriptase/maturase [Boldia erythrosiphon]